MMKLRLDALAIFLFFFIIVTIIGFFAARWQKGNLTLLPEWGLAGRRFTSTISWFLLGGDIYTASTVIAIPGAMFSIGVVSGFFAIPYTALVYPLVFVVLSRLWLVCKRHNYITVADFVQARFGSAWLARAVAFTGLLAAMPYIALQMYGIQLAIAGLGLPLTFTIAGQTVDLPLLLAFLVLASYTYTSGLRAPVLMAFLKDAMLFVVVLALLLLIPSHFHGIAPIFAAAHMKAATTYTFSDLIPAKQQVTYISLTIGSTLALFLYPHTITGILSCHSQQVIKRISIFLPIYTLLLGVIAIAGYMAIASNIHFIADFGTNSAFPALMIQLFPSWFAGFTMATLVIIALVPASIMSIATATLFSRNIYKGFIRKQVDAYEETRVAKFASLLIKFGALLFLLLGRTTQIVYLQFLGGIWILQTLPAVFLGLYTHWFNRWALLIGWGVSMLLGTLLTLLNNRASTYTLFGLPIYIALLALLINLLLTVLLTPLFNMLDPGQRYDLTLPSDYEEEHAPPIPAETGIQPFI
ncbi:sodium:solute symporter family protein [Tengunoibacter tsumagoiensis]|uniref:Sodium:solute symporter n=1 Tax=Tengunoibacter tsumagoiensis TaxID=2014871 RepID=A0A402A2P0_9CHLR|nr:sodium:solute symporter [Tengunoibacter tsumagoiensis]GCE13319.1 sodium:solute symporter [Tengunoibacter tsumagoiensis]